MDNPEESFLNVRIEDKVKSTRNDLFELKQQARVPNVEKNTSAVQPSLKGGGNAIGNMKALLDSRVEGSETKLVGGDGSFNQVGRRRLRRSLINIF